MAKKKGGPAYYSVRLGHTPGIYMTWDECEAQVKGFTGAKYKKFLSKEEAEEFLHVGSGNVIDATYSSSTDSKSGSTSAATRKRTLEHERDESIFKKQRLLSEHEAKDEKDLVVYSDGACKGNGKDGSVAGVGVWWGPGDPRNIAERCPGDQTNNRAELIAIARVLESTPIDTTRRLIIKTDSNYSIQCFDNWLQNWRKNNWKTSAGQPVKNAPLIRYIATLLEGRVSQGQKVRLVYVKGHAGIEGNEGADHLANLGALSGPSEERNWPEEEMLYREMLKKASGDPKHDNSRNKDGGLEVQYTEPPANITDDGSTTQRKEVGELAGTSVPSNDRSTQDTLDPDELAKYAEAWADDVDLLDDLKD